MLYIIIIQRCFVENQKGATIAVYKIYMDVAPFLFSTERSLSNINAPSGSQPTISINNNIFYTLYPF